ncbi:adenylate kinase [Luteitalea sp.]|uniref:adenylate kinase n=1 Tax=Luteitalea sp. TaxID=2004800 RepID=UPI0025BE5DA0|nr:adenylate kinase [Luteitalea sp.]
MTEPGSGKAVPEDGSAGVSRIALLGPPGAGKGTQASRLAGRLGVPHIATGDLLRQAAEAGTPRGLQARHSMDAGELVPDQLVDELVRERIRRPDAEVGFVLDGVPRTLRQGEMLDAALSTLGRPIQRVVLLEVSPAQIVERTARRGTITHRRDDRSEIVANRLRVYHAESPPLTEYYRSRGLLVSIDGVGTVDQVARRIEEVLA